MLRPKQDHSTRADRRVRSQAVRPPAVSVGGPERARPWVPVRVWPPALAPERVVRAVPAQGWPVPARGPRRVRPVVARARPPRHVRPPAVVQDRPRIRAGLRKRSPVRRTAPRRSVVHALPEQTFRPPCWHGGPLSREQMPLRPSLIPKSRFNFPASGAPLLPGSYRRPVNCHDRRNSAMAVRSCTVTACYRRS
jgi:hypothetical protein